jgi:hypothetical protein
MPRGKVPGVVSMLLLAMLLVSEIVGWMAFGGNAMRVGLVIGVLMLGLVPVALCVAQNRPVWLARLCPIHVVILSGLMAVGLAALGVALWRGNDPYFIAADAYHWFIEGLAMAIITAAIFGRASAGDAARAVAIIGLLVGLTCLVAFTLGTLRIFDGGTHFVNNLGIARLIVGRGTPQLMIIIVTAAAWRCRRWDAMTRCLLLVAWAVLALALAVTLKRTLWLSFPIAAAAAIMSRRWLLYIVAATVAFGPVIAVAAMFMPQTVGQIAQGTAETLTYNPGFTIAETLSRRSEQLQSVWPYIIEHPGGHGFGASVFAYWSHGQTYAQVHYIHNFYAYYALQLGVGLLMVVVLLTGWLGWTWLREDERTSDWGFAVRGALGCLVALAINGMSLVATHTLFAGLAIGLGIIGSAKLRQERLR